MFRFTVNRFLVVVAFVLVLFILRAVLFTRSPDSSAKVQTVIVIPSECAAKAQRQAIRDAWGSTVKPSSGNGALVFFVHKGCSDSAPDTVAIGDVNEAMESTKNMRLIMHYVADNYETDYVAKVSDDTFLDFELLTTLLSKKQKKGLVLGFIEDETPVQIQPLHFGKGILPLGKIPQYLRSSVYIFSIDAVRNLVECSAPDIEPSSLYFTGICREMLSYPLSHSAEFSFQTGSYGVQPCVKSILMTSGVTLKEMRRIWREWKSCH